MRILLTGNGSGIGRTLEQSLVADGHFVYGTHSHGDRDFDLGTDADIESLIESAVTSMGGIDVLINNAGVLDSEEFGRLTLGGIERVLRVNLVAPLLLSQGAVGAGAKLIINIGSMYGVTGAYGAKPTYAASKAALHNATLSLSRFLGPTVRVAGIAPGIIDTGIHSGQGGIEKHGDGHANVARCGLVSEVVSAVKFVMDNEYINGTVLEISGGR